MIKVLIADDEINVCKLISNLVNWEEMGMQVIGIANNGIDALEMVKTLQPDIVITDIRMPGYDGIELIRRAKEINPSIDFIIVSGYKHFDYAHNAIQYNVENYLLKPLKKSEFVTTLTKMAERYRQRDQQQNESERLRSRIKNDMQKLRNGFMIDLLFDRTEESGPLSIEKVNAEYHFCFQPGFFQAIVIKTDIPYRASTPEMLKILTDKTAAIAEKQLRPVCHDLLIYCSGSGIYCMMNYDEETRKIFRRLLKSIIDEAMTMNDLFLNLKVTIGAGLSVTELSQLGESIKTARNAVNNRLVQGTGKILDYHKPEGPTLTVGYFINNESTRDFFATVEALDSNAFRQWLDTLFHRISGYVDMDGNLLIKLSDEIIDLFLFAVKKQQLVLQNKNAFLQEYNETLPRCSSVREVFDLLAEFIGDQLDRIAADKKLADSRPIREAKQYMQDHFRLPLTLEEVSGVAGFNPAYFSHLFKKETGMNFLEYLIDLRISRAKELLIQTNQSVYDISEEVGYADLKHFSKLFKKTTGLNPSEYRKIYQ